jgi:hypothetical protein
VSCASRRALDGRQPRLDHLEPPVHLLEPPVHLLEPPVHGLEAALEIGTQQDADHGDDRCVDRWAEDVHSLSLPGEERDDASTRP